MDPGGGFYLGHGGGATPLAPQFIQDVSFISLSSGTPVGRLDTHGYTTSLGNSAYLGYWFTSGWNEVIFGFAWYNPSATFPAPGGVNAPGRICIFKDGATDQCDLRADATGHLFFTRNGTVIGGTSTNALTVGWYYLETKIKIGGGTSGNCEVRVTPLGGVASTWLTVTGVNNKNSSGSTVSRFYIIGPNSGFQYWKDLYILDTGTGINTSYLGDSKVITLYPNAADGTFQQWVANTGTQTAAVQDGTTGSGTYPDDDTTYISDTVAGHISAFQLDTLAANGIKGVNHVTYARTTSSGTINQVLVQSGSVAETSATRTLTTTYTYYSDIQEQNPTGPASWTASGVNSTHPGVKIQATSASARVSQDFLLVLAQTAAVAASFQPQFWVIT
jgi:hypothetical protein